MDMDPPTIVLTTEEVGCQEVSKKTIKFQCGLLRETETFTCEDLELLCRDNLMDYVCDMLNNKVNYSST